MIREIWDENEDDLFRQVEDEAHGRPAKSFTTMSARQLLKAELPRLVWVWGKGLITRGQLCAIVGQGGTGKSRITLQVAVDERAGVAPLGIAGATPGKPNRWLFVGTENGIHRLQEELGKMCSVYQGEQRDRVLDGIHFHVLKEDDDADILLREDNLGRWKAMLEEVAPTVVVADPFGDLHPGDINKPAEVRATVRAFMRLCRSVDKDMAMVIIHHARAGRNNIAGAVGWDQGAFSLGAKDITTMARVQLNVTFTDPEDWGKVMVSLGKANDTERIEPIGLCLNRETMRYEVDMDFDLDEWKADLDGKRSSGTKVSVGQVLQEILETGGPEPRKKWDWLNAVGKKFGGVTGKTIQSKIKKGLEHGYLREDSEGVLRVTEKYRKQQEAAEDGRK
jgi:RecA-family ATPase